MSDPNEFSKDRALIQDLKAGRRAAFVACYDRYAPVLFGILIKITGNRDLAVPLLERTFLNIHSRASELRDNQLSLFAWLLNITRQVADEALAKRAAVPGLTIQLVTNQRVVTAPDLVADAPDLSNETGLMSEESRSKEFLELVLVKRCTPEEAAAKVGISPETARQYLHVALKQVRARSAVN